MLPSSLSRVEHFNGKNNYLSVLPALIFTTVWQEARVLTQPIF